MRPWLPPVNYITVHYTYFIILGLIFTLIFWGSSTPVLSIGFWDSLFLAFSALTSAGLNTVNVSSECPLTSQIRALPQVVHADLIR